MDLARLKGGREDEFDSPFGDVEGTISPPTAPWTAPCGPLSSASQNVSKTVLFAVILAIVPGAYACPFYPSPAVMLLKCRFRQCGWSLPLRYRGRRSTNGPVATQHSAGSGRVGGTKPQLPSPSPPNEVDVALGDGSSSGEDGRW